MSEEERKSVKEFEKKQATFREEQEKYRKALETELRKLQASIGDFCDSFDKSLGELFNLKLSSDQIIFQNELKMIKLTQSSVFSEHDDTREEEINERMELLKKKKSLYMIEVPDIKKELDRCKDEYDAILKRDRDIERQFKKEFHSHDFYFEALMKLFKRRELASVAATTNQPARAVNPFGHDKNFGVWEEPLKLVMEADLPEGLAVELWHRLIDYRERKITIEKDAFYALSRYQEMQVVVQSVIDESEKIRIEVDNLTSDLNQLMDYKFHSFFNVESLVSLKQGQVEIPQASVVTDYTDAVLIHRGFVERLNESIVALGKTKVDALLEIKAYRNGIHALEW